MDILRFTTAGNIDDGKSTLIGRMLLDSGHLKSDIIQSVSKSRDEKAESINLAYITDGLRHEREMGITIDVAYMYFTTAKRKFIITDAPGHFQYIKNLVTGASEVDAMVILIDVNQGITLQTQRHLMVASFLSIPNVIVAVNKMDAVGWRENEFSAIRDAFLSMTGKLKIHPCYFIPISALLGDNVVRYSLNMPWYQGVTLMDLLNNLQPPKPNETDNRFSVQSLLPSDNAFVLGKLLSGKLRVGDTLKIYPQGEERMLKQIILGTENRLFAEAGENLTLRLDEIGSVARGCLITGKNEKKPVQLSTSFSAHLCWLDDHNPLNESERYILQIQTFEVACNVKYSGLRMDYERLEWSKVEATPSVNDIFKAEIQAFEFMAWDDFGHLPETGKGILINPISNNTVAVFTIQMSA